MTRRIDMARTTSRTLHIDGNASIAERLINPIENEGHHNLGRCARVKLEVGGLGDQQRMRLSDEGGQVESEAVTRLNFDNARSGSAQGVRIARPSWALANRDHAHELVEAIG